MFDMFLFLSRQALEAKAALYDCLCRGEGLREEEEDSEGEEEEGGKRGYLVDFTRKIVQGVSVCVWVCEGEFCIILSLCHFSLTTAKL